MTKKPVCLHCNKVIDLNYPFTVKIEIEGVFSIRFVGVQDYSPILLGFSSSPTGGKIEFYYCCGNHFFDYLTEGRDGAVEQVKKFKGGT